MLSHYVARSHGDAAEDVVQFLHMRLEFVRFLATKAIMVLSQSLGAKESVNDACARENEPVSLKIDIYRVTELF